jgi:hypothetical protein
MHLTEFMMNTQKESEQVSFTRVQKERQRAYMDKLTKKYNTLALKQQETTAKLKIVQNYKHFKGGNDEEDLNRVLGDMNQKMKKAQEQLELHAQEMSKVAKGGGKGRGRRNKEGGAAAAGAGGGARRRGRSKSKKQDGGGEMTRKRRGSAYGGTSTSRRRENRPHTSPRPPTTRNNNARRCKEEAVVEGGVAGAAEEGEGDTQQEEEEEFQRRLYKRNYKKDADKKPTAPRRSKSSKTISATRSKE